MDLEAGAPTCFDQVMSTTLIEVRPAKAADASAVASTHDEAWRSAYQGMKSRVIWALSDNDPATEFYRALGGRMVARSSEKFGPKSLDKVAFAWSN